jgi:hypothetical protein
MQQVKYIYENTQLTLQKIADASRSSYKIVWKFVAENYTKEYRDIRKKQNYRNSKLGANNPSFGRYGKDSRRYIGEISDGKGYLIHLRPAWFTGRTGSKHIFVHHLVYCEANGLTEMPEGYVIHHIDLDPTNNDIENLQLMTPSDHTKLHQLLRKS